MRCFSFFFFFVLFEIQCVFYSTTHLNLYLPPFKDLISTYVWLPCIGQLSWNPAWLTKLLYLSLICPVFAPSLHSSPSSFILLVFRKFSFYLGKVSFVLNNRNKNLLFKICRDPKTQWRKHRQPVLKEKSFYLVTFLSISVYC